MNFVEFISISFVKFFILIKKLMFLFGILSNFVYNKTMKKFLLSLFTIFMSLGLACGSAFLVVGCGTQEQSSLSEEQPEEEESAPIESTATGYWKDYANNGLGGKGTKTDPYIIDSAQALANYAWMINGGDDHNTIFSAENGETLNEGYAELTADIDLSAHYWTPIGSYSHAFQGYFDGNGHTISGIHITISGRQDFNNQIGWYRAGGALWFFGDKYVGGVGLFGVIDDGSSPSDFKTIHDLNIDNVNINISGSDGAGFLQDYVINIGGFAGVVQGLWEINNIKMTNVNIYCSDQSNATFQIYGVGGVVGYSSGGIGPYRCEIEDSRIDINTTVECVGGVGGAVDKLSNCYADVSLDVDESNMRADMALGGICGAYSFVVNNCVFAGDILFDISENVRKGILVGGIAGKDIDDGAYGGVNNCINYGNLSIDGTGFTRAGGIIGQITSRINIYQCANLGNLSLTFQQCSDIDWGYGGILGYMEAGDNNIYQCVNYGNIYCYGAQERRQIGGIVGYLRSSSLVSGCINFGKMQGGTESHNVGGIVGYANNSWWSDDARIANCVNFSSNITGNYEVRKILGYTEDSGKVHNCYSVNGGGHEQNGTSKTITQLCNTSFYTTSGNWTSAVYDRHQAYLPTFTWDMAVTNYFSSSELSSRGLNTSKPLPMPTDLIDSMTVQIQYHRGSSETYSLSDYDGDYAYVNSEGSTSSVINFLVGADYTDEERSRRLFDVFYRKTYFSMDSITCSDSSVEFNYTTSTTSTTGINKVNLLFKTPRILALRVYVVFDSLDVKDIDIYTSKSYNTTDASLSDDGGKVSVKRQGTSSTALYLNDDVSITATPNVGYAVWKITYTPFNANNTITTRNLYEVKEHKVSLSAQANWNMSIITGKIESGQNYTDSNEPSNSVYCRYIYEYHYGTINVYFVPISYLYHVLYIDGNSSRIDNRYFNINDKGYNFQRDVNNTQGFAQYGFRYTFYLVRYEEGYLNNPPAESVLARYVMSGKSGVQLDYSQGAITLTADDILAGIKKLSNALQQKSFLIFIEREAIDYDITLHNMTQTYDGSYQEMKDTSSLREILFGNMSTSAYRNLYGSAMPIYDVDMVSHFENGQLEWTFNITDNPSIIISALNSKLGYNSGMTWSFYNDKNEVLPDNSQQDDVEYGSQFFINQYILEFKSSSTDIDIYIFHDLKTYDIQIDIMIDGKQETTSGIGFSSQINGESQGRYTEIDSVLNYALVGLQTTVPAGNRYQFAGWYLNDGSLLSLQENYYFIYNYYEYASENENVNNNNTIEIYANYISRSDSTGSGSQPNNNVYTISSADDLLWLSAQVANGRTFEGITINQTANIDMNGLVFAPIGSVEHPFMGVYNGNNFVIENLGNNLATQIENYENALKYRGLFGYIENATIKNLSLVGGTVRGFAYTGGFVGYAKDSTLQNLNNNSCQVVSNYLPFHSVVGGEITHNMTASRGAQAVDVQQYVGGLAGYAENCDIYACSNRATLDCGIGDTNYVNYVGGFVGYSNGGTIDQSFSHSESAKIGTDTESEDEEVSDPNKFVADFANGSATITNCYAHYRGGNYLFNATLADGQTESGLYNGNSLTRYDTSIWLIVNNSITLKVFYWA